MTGVMFMNAAILLAVGCALLFTWRHDKTQPFTRWLGLSFVITALWVPAYWLYFHSSVPLAGALVWATQASLGQVCLVLGVTLMGGRRPRATTLVALGVFLFVLYGASAWLNPRTTTTFSAFATLGVSVLIAPILLKGQAPERFAGVTLLLYAFSQFIVPALGMAALPAQNLVSGILRLVLGLALIYACLLRSSQAKQRLSEQFSRLTEGSHQGVVVIQDGQVAYANPELLRIFRLEHKGQIPADWEQWGLSEADRQMNERRQQRLVSGRLESVTWEQDWKRQDGVLLRLRLSTWNVDWEGRTAQQVVISDETELLSTTRQLLHQATHDDLTGLPNRPFARQRLDELIADASPQDRTAALLLINLDNFSGINDSLGYAAGDEFLRMAAARIQGALSASDTLARLSGDEFVVIHPPQAHMDAGALSENILAVLRQPFHMNGLNLSTSGSIGVAVYPADGAGFDTLLGHATIAARRAKSAGHNTARFFNESMNAHLLEDMHLSTDLGNALKLDQLSLFLQPVVEAASARIVGAEALLRWQHPQRGFVPPGRFIPIAERTGLIVDIGAWVMNEACRLLGAWQAHPALSDLVLSINASATQFSRDDIDQVLAAALTRHQPPRHLLEIEITESALINDPEQFVRKLAQLRAMGVQLAIDDFGTGYSNLTYLQRFQVDRLKIDQAFVQRLRGSPQARAIVRAVIQMAGSLNLKTTAEGIEDAETRDELIRLGCDHLQGYLFARPMPVADFEALVVKDRENVSMEHR